MHHTALTERFASTSDHASGLSVVLALWRAVARGVHQRTQRALAWLGVLGAAFVLAACGGGGGGGGSGTGTISATQAPSMLIRTDASGEIRSTFKVAFYFSAPVSFPSGTLPFALTGASVVSGSFTQVATDTYFVTLTPNANAQGLVDIRVPIGAYADASGKYTNTSAYEYSQPFNTLVPYPTMTFGGTVNALGYITGAGTFTLKFNTLLDAPMTAAKLAVSTGTISQFTKTSTTGQADVYTFLYTPPAATNGAVSFEILKGAVSTGGIGNDLNWWNYGLSTP